MSEQDNVHTLIASSGAKKVLFADIFTGSCVVKADAIAYVYDQLIRRGILIEKITLLDDKEFELVAALYQQKRDVPLFPVRADLSLGGKSLVRARMEGCLQQLDNIFEVDKRIELADEEESESDYSLDSSDSSVGSSRSSTFFWAAASRATVISPVPPVVRRTI